MSRFMSFYNIMDLVISRTVQPGLIIRCVATDETLVLNEFQIVGDLTRYLGFFTEDRTLVQTIDPNSVWELVNIELGGDISE